MSLPPKRWALQGFLWAVIGSSASAQEAPVAGLPSDAAGLGASEERATGNLPVGIDQGAAPAVQTGLAPDEPPEPHFQRLPDGRTVLTISWDTSDGDSVARKSADLVLTAVPVPEPTFSFLGACAGCVVLLYRRRATPSKLRPARANLSVDGVAHLAPRQATTIRRRSFRAPREPRARPTHRLVSHRVFGMAPLFPAHPRPGKL